MQVNHNRFLSYTKDKNGNIIIDEKEAEVVKCREYLEGYSMDKIAKGLVADGILIGAKNSKWHTSTLSVLMVGVLIISPVYLNVCFCYFNRLTQKLLPQQ